MKKILLLFLTLFQVNTTYAQWDVKNVDTEINTTLHVIKFYNENVGFAMGVDGKILKTTDQGEHWDEVENNIIGTILDFDFLALDTIVTISTHFEGGVSERRIYKSTNGGLSWTEKYTETDGGFICIQFLNTQIGFVSGSDYIFKTYDGGESWEIVYDILLDDFDFGSVSKFEMLNDSIGYGLGMGLASDPSPTSFQSVFLKTIDGGNSWQEIYQFDGWYEELDFRDTEVGFISSSANMLKTTNGGVSWDTLNNIEGVVGISIPSLDKVVTVNLPPAYIIAAPWTEFAISRSFDLGTSWDGELSKGAHMESVFYLTDSIGFVAGDYSIIMKTENCDGEITGDYPWDLFTTSTKDLKTTALDIFPNPAKSRLFLNDLEDGEWTYSIQSFEGISIDAGQLRNGKIDIAHIPVGVYFLVLENEAISRVGKFMKW